MNLVVVVVGFLITQCTTSENARESCCKFLSDYYLKLCQWVINKYLEFPSNMFLKPSRHGDETTNASAVLDHDRLIFQRDQSPHKTKNVHQLLILCFISLFLSPYFFFCNSLSDIKGDKLLSLIPDLVHFIWSFPYSVCLIGFHLLRDSGFLLKLIIKPKH